VSLTTSAAHPASKGFMKTRRFVFNVMKFSISIIGLLALILVMGFYSLPALLKTQLPDLIEQATGQKSSIATLELSLVPLEIHLTDFEIKDKTGLPLAAFNALTVKINVLQSLKQSALVVDNLLLKTPFVHLVRTKSGAFNFQDVLKNKAEAKQQDNRIIPITIAKLSLSEGRLVWEDNQLATPIKQEIIPINLTIDDFSTLSDQPPFKLMLSLTSNTLGRLDWTGTVLTHPLSSTGHIKLEAIDLEKALALAVPMTLNLQGISTVDADYSASYTDNNVKLAINKATLALKNFHYAQNGQIVSVLNAHHTTDLTFGYNDTHWQLEAHNATLDSQDWTLTQDSVLVKIAAVKLATTSYKVSSIGKQLNVIVDKGTVDSRDVQLSAQGQEKTLAKLPLIALQGIDFNLNDKAVTVASVAANDADFKLWLNPDGAMNYQTLFFPPKTEATLPRIIESEQVPWTVNVNNIALTHFGMVFEDRTQKKPVTVQFKDIDFKLDNYSTKNHDQLPFQLSLGVNKTGLIKLEGSGVISPLTATVNLDIKDIELEKFQPYYDKFVRLDVIDGALNIDGALHFAHPADNELDIKFNGNAEIASLLTRDQKVNKDLVKWERFTLKDLMIDVQENRYTAASLAIDQPYARVTIRKDKTVNFSDLIIADQKPPQLLAHSPVIRKKPYLKLGKITVTEGSSDFTDLSLILPFATHIQSLDGGASGVSSEQQSVITVALKGNAYDLAPVDLKGTISPYLGDYHVELNFYGLPMPLISPYMVQFAGYKVEKGKMTLGLNYDVVNKHLTASNRLLIDQFELGEKVDNPNAVSLPLKLAVALLKDASGKIKFDVPITGSLEDPQFNIGALMTDALFNAITKVVASPFHAVAALFGSDADLSSINFTAGNAMLEPAELKKLDDVAKALQTKPALNLDIKGAAFQIQDWPAISDDALYDQLKHRRADEINKISVKKIRPEYVKLTAQDYNRLLAAMFIEKFPLLAETSLLGTPQLKNPQLGDFYDLARQKLYEVIKPEQQRLKELAAARAQAIAKYIVQKGGVPQERVFILDTVVDNERSDKTIASSLSLKAD
jgi:hypothetical protein